MSDALYLDLARIFLLLRFSLFTDKQQILRAYDEMNFPEYSLFQNKVKYLHKFKTTDI